MWETCVQQQYNPCACNSWNEIYWYWSSFVCISWNKLCNNSSWFLLCSLHFMLISISLSRRWREERSRVEGRDTRVENDNQIQIKGDAKCRITNTERQKWNDSRQFHVDFNFISLHPIVLYCQWIYFLVTLNVIFRLLRALFVYISCVCLCVSVCQKHVEFHSSLQSLFKNVCFRDIKA